MITDNKFQPVKYSLPWPTLFRNKSVASPKSKLDAIQSLDNTVYMKNQDACAINE